MYKWMEWIAKAAGLNLLWILFTLCGFGLLGLFPATVALLMVTRDVKTGNQKGIGASFLNYYVENFIKANAYGYLIMIINIALISLAIQSVHSSVLLTIPIFVVTVLVFMISLYLLPVFTYFHASFLNHLKLSSVMALGHPVVSFVLVSLFALNFGVIFYSRILIAFPILFLFFMVSVSAYFVMVVLLPVFRKYGESEKAATSNQVSEI